MDLYVQDSGGKDTMYSEKYKVENFSAKIVLDLTDPLLGKGHTLYLDNWYTSPRLVDKLVKSKTDCVGTMSSNRKEFPQTVKSAKLKKGEITDAFCGKQMISKISALRMELQSLNCRHFRLRCVDGKFPEIVTDRTCIHIPPEPDSTTQHKPQPQGSDDHEHRIPITADLFKSYSPRPDVLVRFHIRAVSRLESRQEGVEVVVR
ncbi:hypothetical protein J437_LFUL016609 [Ladona fulva]|uniref:PiggyBac transposable element-derived protein domain-containing protein n=1 Tax=Ladona fulva TaxID=123851 RepID=A0A8K0KS47_LADFU|nr:hypothetical protein J437_LFUL016609 [Ladona fulva]